MSKIVSELIELNFVGVEILSKDGQSLERFEGFELSKKERNDCLNSFNTEKRGGNITIKNNSYITLHVDSNSFYAKWGDSGVVIVKYDGDKILVALHCYNIKTSHAVGDVEKLVGIQRTEYWYQ